MGTCKGKEDWWQVNQNYNRYSSEHHSEKTGDYKPEKLLKVLSMCPALVKITFITSKIIHPSMQQQMKVL